MPDSDRNSHTAIIAFAFTICLLIVGLIGWYQGFKVGQESHQANSAEAYANQSDREISDTCVGLPDAAMRECITKAIRTAREQQRAEQDLDAQQQMSEWAKWMLIATVVMAAVTLFGVIFVWQTLVATRQMAVDTRSIGEKQVRAYVSTKEVALTCRKGKLFVSVELFNAGSSPALDVEYQIFGQISTQSGIENIEFGRSFGKLCPPVAVRDLPGGVFSGANFYSIQFATEEMRSRGHAVGLDISSTDTASLTLEIRYSYRTIFKKQVFDSVLAFWDIPTPLGRNFIPDFDARTGLIYPTEFAADAGRVLEKPNRNNQ